MNDDDRKKAIRLIEGMQDDIKSMKRSIADQRRKQSSSQSSLRCSIGIHSYGLTKVTIYGHIYHCRRCGKRKINGPYG